MELKNKLLVATGSLNHPFYSNSVVYISDESDDEVSGFIVNGKLVTTMPLAMDKIKLKLSKEAILKSLFTSQSYETSIYFGGPKLSSTFMIHGREDLASNLTDEEKGLFEIPLEEDAPTSMLIDNKLFYGSPIIICRMSSFLEDNLFKFLIGTSGWDKDDIHNQIKQGFWKVKELEDSSLLFDENYISGLTTKSFSVSDIFKPSSKSHFERLSTPSVN